MRRDTGMHSQGHQRSRAFRHAAIQLHARTQQQQALQGRDQEDPCRHGEQHEHLRAARIESDGGERDDRPEHVLAARCQALAVLLDHLAEQRDLRQ